MSLNAHRYVGSGPVGDAAGEQRGPSARSLGGCSTAYEFFFHPTERAGTGGLGLVGANTPEGAADLLAKGYERFSAVMLVDTSVPGGVARLPSRPGAGTGTGTGLATEANNMTKEQLRNQPALAIEDMSSLPDSFPSLHTGPGNLTDKVVEQFETKLVDEDRMQVLPPLRYYTKDKLAELKATRTFKSTLTTRWNMYYAIKTPGVEGITEDLLAESNLSASALITAARNHVKDVVKPTGRYDYHSACLSLYNNST